jgi:hypothetical protein
MRPNLFFAFVRLKLFSIAFFEFIVFLKAFVFDNGGSITERIKN